MTCEKQFSSSKTKFNFFSPQLVKGVLLLQQLTKSNAAIQKIVAFENAFERLLDIITEEGNSDGGTQKSKTFFHSLVLLHELLVDNVYRLMLVCNWS